MDPQNKDAWEEQKLDETSARRLIQSALDGPARPLCSDQIEALTARAAVRWSAGRLDVPLWALGAMCAGVLVVLGLAWQSSAGWTGVIQAALLIPLVNLALSPVAAWVIIKRLNQQGGKQ